MIERTRPLGVAVIALFLLIDAVLSIGELLGLVPVYVARLPLSELAWARPLLVAVGIVEIVTAIGLWRGSRPAWVLAMVLVGLSLVGDLYLYFFETPRYARMTIDIVLAFYLNQGSVREHFADRRDPRPQAT